MTARHIRVSLCILALLASSLSLDVLAQLQSSAVMEILGKPSSAAQPPGMESSSPSAFNSNASTALFQTPSRAASAEPLPVERAFAINAQRQSTGVTIEWIIAPGYYLYKDKIDVKAVAPATLSGLKLPTGIVKFDDTFNKQLSTYRTQLSLADLKVHAGDAETIVLHAYSQGCSDLGICYPPQRQQLTFSGLQAQATVKTLDYVPPTIGSAVELKPVPSSDKQTIAPSTQQSSDTSSGQISAQQTTSNVLTSDHITAQLKTTSPLWLALGFIGFGLLLSFTPCVLPMVPIVSAIVLGTRASPSGQHLNSKQSVFQGFKLSLTYVIGMCITYTALGLLVGLIGSSLTGYLQHPVLLSAFAIIMLVLAGAQFGWYPIALPGSWLNSISQQPNQIGYLRYGAIALMGALSAIMVGPCVTVPLAGVLAYIAQSGSVWIGGLALFSLSLGMGIPLLIVGAGGSRLLPKPGAWMKQINHGFGILLLGVALWMVQSLLAPWLLTLGWLTILLLIAEQLGALRDSNPSDTRPLRLARLLGWACLVWGATIIVGMTAGKFDALQPLSSLAYKAQLSSPTSNRSPFTLLASQDLERTLMTSQGKPIMLDVYADWCVSCIEFERYTFSDPQVAAALGQFKLLKVDVTRNTAADQQLLKTLKLFGPPAIVFYSASGIEIENNRVIGFLSAKTFLQHLDRVLAANR
jgi:thioredoxin:protein disulfide reductase